MTTTRDVTLRVNVSTNAEAARKAFQGISDDLQAAQGRLAKLQLQLHNPHVIEQQATADRHVAAAQLRVDAVRAQTLASHYATPYGQRELQQNAGLEASKSLSQQRVETMKTQAEAAHMATPAGRAETGERVKVTAAKSLADLRKQVLGAQAKAAWTATPEGRADFRKRRDLEAAKTSAELKQKQQENIAAFGQLGGGLANAKDSLVSMAKAASPWVAAARAATDAGYGFAAAASPSAAKTLSSSLELLSAKIGHSFVPALDEASRALQSAGVAWDKLASTQLVGKSTYGEGLGAVAGWVPRSATNAIQGLSGQRPWLSAGLDVWGGNFWADQPKGSLGQRLSRSMGWKDDAPDMTKDLVLPMQSKTFQGPGGFSQFEMGLQSSALNAGANQTQMQAMQEQLKELMRSNQLLSQIAQNSNEARGTPPTFG